MSVSNPKQVEIPAPEDFISFEAERDQASVVTHFAAWARKTPDKLALSAAEKSFSYAELNRVANRLANRLLDVLGPREEPVGILLGKESEAVISILAILKAGKFYVGLDPASPAAYLQAILEDLGPRMILTNSRYLPVAESLAGEGLLVINVEQLADDLPAKEPDLVVSLETLAGIYYTSGSTGKPKGVMVDHRAMWFRTYSGIMSLKTSPSDRICLPFPIGFGWSTSPLFGALVTGASLFLYDFSGKSVSDVADWFIQNRITYTPMPPAFFRQFISALPENSGSKFPDLRIMFIGGETMQKRDLELWQKRFSVGCFLRYGFSSTEVGPTIYSNYAPDQDISEANLTFGSAALGVKVFIRDEQGQLLQSSATGEIVVSSRGVMKGYWKRDELNQKVFIADPDNPGRTLYLTGDLGRLNDEYRLEFLGRKDTQVKIRGYRVDLLNIEAVMRNLPAIQDVVVTPYKGKNGATRLAAYLVFKPGQSLPTQEIKNYLGAQLAPFMVPSSFCVLDTLPYNATGKVITRALPAPSRERPELANAYVAPQGDLGVQLAEIWKKVLDLELVGSQDNFFELGGDSLMVLEMTLEVEQLLSKPVPPAFFKQPTISNLIMLLETGQPAEKLPGTFVLESHRSEQRAHRSHRRGKSRKSKLTRLFTRKYSAKDFGRLRDRLVTGYMLSLPYLKANEWAVKWSQNTFVLRFLYRSQAELFSRWLAGLKDCQSQPEEAFQMSVLNNLNFEPARHLGLRRRNVQLDVAAYQNSPHPYWQTLGTLLEAIPAGGLSDLFPISGLEHLLQARQQGRGVILLTFHGTPLTLRFFALERFLKVEKIPTISYHTPLRQSRYNGREDEMPEAASATLNAELALYAQRQLQEGQLINFASDTHDFRGRTYQIPLAGKVYQFKGGFAELALNTGAAIIPHFRYCLPDGRIQLSLGAPLEPGHGERDAQVKALLEAYAAFIEQAWATHPEAMKWKKIRRHLSKPSVSEAG